MQHHQWTVATVLATLAIATATTNGQIDFEPAVSYPVGYPVEHGPLSVVAVDLNSDGFDDLVATQATSSAPFSGLAVLFNDGDGTFSPAQGFLLMNLTTDFLSLGDLDGDGDLDIAVITPSDSAVHLLRNTGQGVPAPVGSVDFNGPTSVALDDLNGDDLADLAVTDGSGAHLMYVRLNDGDGTFPNVQAYPVGGNPRWVTAADLDGDGDRDLVTANASGSVSVLLNDGAGAFAAAVNYVIGNAPSSVLAADFDEDGDLDLVVAREFINTVTILLNNGGAIFGAPVGYTVGEDPVALAVGDLNNDTHLDLATANDGPPASVSVLLGAGDGTFVRPSLVFQAGIRTNFIAMNFLDSDNRLDLVVSNWQSKDVSVLINRTPIAPPVGFDLLSPADGGVAVELTPTLQWTVADGDAVTYAVRLATDSRFKNIVLEASGLTATSLDVPAGFLDNATPYYWGVVASNPIGGTASTPPSASFFTLIVGDLNADGCVDSFDLAIVLGTWCSAVNDPNPPSPPCENCLPQQLSLADITGPGFGPPDGCVDAFDLAKLLGDWCSVAGGNRCGSCQ